MNCQRPNLFVFVLLVYSIDKTVEYGNIKIIYFIMIIATSEAADSMFCRL